MRLISRILVLLDQSSMDETLIKYINSIVNRSPVEELYVLNVIRSFHLPDEIKKEFPDLEKKAISERKEQINQFLKENYKYWDSVKPQILVNTGSALKNVLQLSSKLDITGVVVGRKKTGTGHGILTQRLARRLPASLIIIPQGSSGTLQNEEPLRLLVPVDFSKHSKTALQQAITFAVHEPKGTEIYVQHVYSVPSGYHYSGKTFDEFAEVMERNSERDYKAFVKDINFKGVKITPIFSLNKDDDMVKTVYNLAHEMKADAIFFASKGRSGATAYFLGSTAERLLKIETECPLIVIRRKNEFKSILETIKEI